MKKPGQHAKTQLSSILCGDIMVPNIEKDYILLLGIVFYIRNIILLGSTTKKHYSVGSAFTLVAVEQCSLKPGGSSLELADDAHPAFIHRVEDLTQLPAQYGVREMHDM